MNPIVVTFVTACTALVAALVGPFITLKIGRAQINASVLSTNRQKWIDNFRDLVAAFCSQAFTALYLREKVLEGGRIVMAQDPDLLRRLEHLLMTFTKLRLMINPLEADHQALVGILESTMKTLRTAPLNTELEDDLEVVIDRIVAATQVILKREWVRVKSGQ